MDANSTVYGPGSGLGCGLGVAGCPLVRPRHGQPCGGDPTLFLPARVGGGRPAAGPTRRAW